MAKDEYGIADVLDGVAGRCERCGNIVFHPELDPVFEDDPMKQLIF